MLGSCKSFRLSCQKLFCRWWILCAAGAQAIGEDAAVGGRPKRPRTDMYWKMKSETEQHPKGHQIQERGHEITESQTPGQTDSTTQGTVEAEGRKKAALRRRRASSCDLIRLCMGLSNAHQRQRDAWRVTCDAWRVTRFFAALNCGPPTVARPSRQSGEPNEQIKQSNKQQ